MRICFVWFLCSSSGTSCSNQQTAPTDWPSLRAVVENYWQLLSQGTNYATFWLDWTTYKRYNLSNILAEWNLNYCAYHSNKYNTRKTGRYGPLLSQPCGRRRCQLFKRVVASSKIRGFKVMKTNHHNHQSSSQYIWGKRGICRTVKIFHLFECS